MFDMGSIFGQLGQTAQSVSSASQPLGGISLANTTPQQYSPFGNMLAGLNTNTAGNIVQPIQTVESGEQGGGVSPLSGYAVYEPTLAGRHERDEQYALYNSQGQFDSMQDFKPQKTSLDTWGPMVVGAMAGLGAMGALGGGAGAGVGGMDAAAMYGVEPGLGAGGVAAGGGGGGLGSLFGGTGGGVPPNPFVGGGGGLGSLFGGGGVGGNIIGKVGTSLLGQILGGGGSGGSGTGSSTGGGLGGGLGNMSLADLIGLIGGGVDANRQGQAAQKMLEWLNANQAKMDNYMKPDSPEYNALWEAMSRKDAAAGRNSQYGPRTADFAAKVAEAKANNTRMFTTGTSRAYADALNQDAAKYAGLSAALQRAGGGSNNMSSILNGLGSLFGNSSGSSISNDEFWKLVGSEGMPIDYGAGLPDPTEDDVWEWINGGDLGQYF